MLPVNPKLTLYTSAYQNIPHLTSSKLRLIEDSTVLEVVEKVNLVALFLGYKQITDIAIDSKKADEAKELLNKLRLPFADNFYYDPRGRKHEWIQVAASRAVLGYVIDRREELTILEAGVLYGYPASACLAYAGMIEKTWFEKTVAEYFLSGVFSKAYTLTERQHFERIWTAIAETSPVIATAAEQEYMYSGMRE